MEAAEVAVVDPVISLQTKIRSTNDSIGEMRFRMIHTFAVGATRRSAIAHTRNIAITSGEC